MVNCTFPEAILVAQNLDRHQLEQLKARIPWIKRAAERSLSLKEWLAAYRNEAGPCPFLDLSGNCAVYEVRPISCRSLFSTKPKEWCVTDFAELSSHEKQLFIESLDSNLVAFPTHYAATPQDIGRELEEATLRQMEAEYGFSMMGCLPWMVWLELEHQMGGRLAGGCEAVKEYLEERELLDPYLLILAG